MAAQCLIHVKLMYFLNYSLRPSQQVLFTQETYVCHMHTLYSKTASTEALHKTGRIRNWENSMKQGTSMS